MSSELFSRILGTGSYVPQKIVTNFDLEKSLDTTDEWITQRTGIKQRHLIDPQFESTVYMAKQSGQMALDNAGIKASDLDMIIVATCTPDKVFPSTACLLQKEFGIKGCAALDVDAACSGFVYALSTADAYIKSKKAKYILVVGSESMSRLLDWNDRSSCVLFGDGSGAVVVGPDSKAGIISTHLHADGNNDEILQASYNYYNTELKEPIDKIHMAGKEVFKIAVNTLGSIVSETIDKNGFSADEIDWLVPHQANIRIIQAMAKKLKMTTEKVIITVDKHANTSGASIPLALHDAVADGRIKRDDLLLLEAFGAGLTWGSALIRY